MIRLLKNKVGYFFWAIFVLRFENRKNKVFHVMNSSVKKNKKPNRETA